MTHWKLRFFSIWTGQAFSLLGSSLVSFALIWWLTEQTGSPSVLATATLVTLLPTVLLGPFAGTLVDRWSRRWAMVGADGLVALFTALLIYLFARGAAQPQHLYIVMFLRALAGAFHHPAMLASTSLMVPQEQLTRVSGMNQTLGGVLRIVAPPLGALLLRLLPMQGVLAVDLVTAALAIAPLLCVSIPQPARPTEAAAQPPFLREVAGGFHYLWNWRALFLIVITCALTDFFLGPARSFLPLLVMRDLHGGALELGGLSSVQGIGIIVGGVVMSAWGGFRRRILTSLLGWAGIGLACLVVAAAPVLGLAFAAFGFAGLMLPVGAAPLEAFLQSTVPSENQGRFFAVLNALWTAMQPLGLVVAGGLGEAVSPRAWWALMGLAHIVLALVWLLTPSILRIEDHSRQSAPTPEPAQVV